MIDIFLPNRSIHTFFALHANRLIELLEREKIPYRKIIFSEGDFSQYLLEAPTSPPIGAISFIPYLNNRFPLHYLFKRPLLQISENNSLEPNYSPFFHQTLSDQRCASFTNLHFMPIPFDVDHSPACEKDIDLVLFQDLIDPLLLKELWGDTFSQEETKKMFELEKELEKEGFHPLDILSQPDQIPYSFYYACETYWSAKKAEKFVESIKVPLHIFGTHVGGNWYKKLSNKESVHLHSMPCYRQILQLLSHTKIVLFHPPTWLDGFPRYFLEALEKQALPLIPSNPYLQNLFEDINIFYSKETLPQLIDNYQRDDVLRNKVLTQLRQVDLSSFNWSSFFKKTMTLFRN